MKSTKKYIFQKGYLPYTTKKLRKGINEFNPQLFFKQDTIIVLADPFTPEILVSTIEEIVEQKFKRCLYIYPRPEDSRKLLTYMSKMRSIGKIFLDQIDIVITVSNVTIIKLLTNIFLSITNTKNMQDKLIFFEPEELKKALEMLENK